MKLPKEVLVYVYDYEDGKPLYAVAVNPNDIPEDCHSNKVGNYVLNNTLTFKVKRELK